ncbi:MAG: SMP-30/gluconolactonase/LRE family protein [Myxococcales bacterium]
MSTNGVNRTVVFTVTALWAGLVLLAGCSAGGSGPGGSGGAGTGGVGSGGVSSGDAGTGGAGTGGVSSGDSGGAAPSTGGASAGTSGTGGTGGAAPQGGATGGATSGTGGGAGGGGPIHGGASGRFVCPAGATYGAPTWGAVTQFGPPTSGAVTNFQFLEGPTWIASIGTLFFSDVGAKPEHTFKLVPPATAAALFLQGSGTNGLSLDSEDKLIVADQKDRSVLRVDPMTGATIATLVPPGAGAFTMDSPNDIIVRSDGNIYLTDPNSGLYRAAPSGASTGPYKLTGPFKEVNSPNGVVLSTDENTLYVGDLRNQQIKRFPVMADGTIDTANGHLLATAKNASVDGLCLDCAGNLYASTSGGIEVFSPAGAALGMVPTGGASNCTFGGADRKTMYVAARSVLKVVPMTIPGLPD